MAKRDRKNKIKKEEQIMENTKGVEIKIEEEIVVTEKKETAMEQLVRKIAEAGGDVSKVKTILESNYVSSGKPSASERLNWIVDTDSIKELKRRIKIAAASKSKMKDNAAAYERYEAQIKAGSEKLNEMILVIESEETLDAKIKKSIEMDNVPGSTLNNYVLPRIKEEYEARLLKVEAFEKESLAHRKQFIMATPTHLSPELTRYLNDLGEGYLEEFVKRLESKDNRVIVLVKTAKLVELVETEEAI